MNLGYVYAPYVSIQILDQKERDMDDMVVLRERNPATAEFVAAWRQKYERTFDLTDDAEKATFYEGVVEMARHIATSADTVTPRAIMSIDGVSCLMADAIPHSDVKTD